MSSAGPRISRELQEALRQAFAEAEKYRHEYVTLEHVLLGLLEDPTVAEALDACGADSNRLRRDVLDFLEHNLERLPEDSELQVQQTLSVRRVLQRAAIHVVSSDQEIIRGNAVLVQMYNEEESFAVYLLEREGVTQFDLKRFVSHGIRPGGLAEQRKKGAPDSDDDLDDDSDLPPKSDPLETSRWSKC